jgi:hypothetical protein
MASGISRSGKPVQAGDTVSITGTVVSVTGTGPSAVLVILCSGALNGPTDTTTGAYSYTLTSTTPSTNPPTAGVYAADVTASQSL